MIPMFVPAQVAAPRPAAVVQPVVPVAVQGRAFDREDQRARNRDERVVVAVPVVNTDAAYNDLGPVGVIETFWNIVEGLRWHNCGDGIVNVRIVSMTINQLAPLQRRIFKEKYIEFFNMMKERLDLDDMFARNGVFTVADKAKIVSHAVAMGRDTFTTLFDDPAFFQFLIETGECQSLDVCLPDDIQCA